MSSFSKKGGALDINSHPGVDLSAGRDIWVPSRTPLAGNLWPSNPRPPGAVGEMRAHLARRESGAASPAKGIRRPGGCPRLAFQFLPRRPMSSEAASRFGHMVKCARIWRPVSWAPQPNRTSSAVPAGGHAWLTSSPLVVRAFGEVRAHLAPGESSPQPDAFAWGRRSDRTRGGHSCKTAMG